MPASSLVFKRAKELLIIVPAVHIFVCFCFLFFYYSSFGYGIWLFASPADIFSVSFSDVAPAYLFLGLGLLFGRFILAPPPSGKPPSKAVAKVDTFNRWLFLMLAVAMCAIGILYWARTGFFPFMYFLPVTAILLAIAFVAWGRTLISDSVMAEIALVSALVLMAAVFYGLSAGQQDRSEVYSELVKARPTCEGKVILRSVSSKFLAVAQDNSRIIVDDDCKQKFTLISSGQFVVRPRKSVHDLVFGR